MQRNLISLLAASLVLATVSCHSNPSIGSAVGNAAAREAGSWLPHDQHSLSRPNEVRVTHVDLDLAVDFVAKQLRGEARLELVRFDPEAPLVLDTQALTILGVLGEDGQVRDYKLGAEQGRLGRPLTIQLQPGDEAVRVRYTTGAEGEAVQWLGPEQTAGQVQPFLFTQGQAILTRSWIPLQDTPGARVSYSARIEVPEALTAVMSAEAKPARAAQTQVGRQSFYFALDLPIPCYLIALAVGDLESAKISDRCAIWAEPSVLPAAAAEFEDTESMIVAAEGLFGDYRWGRYDVLVLPPAFPYGGMENPLLTFATPTVIAGDKSLVALIAHELAHSWSGNLVTNATWNDFWLNEGFTVYLEKRIMEVVYGQERADMERALDWAGLQHELADLEPWQTILHIDLEGHHPDDGFSGIPYDKGCLFLMRLEQVVGREALSAFLSNWFDSHAFKSVTTEDFLAFLAAELPQAAEGMDLDAWIEQPGLPDDAPRTTSPILQGVDTQREALLAGTPASELDVSDWSTQAWLRFLKAMPTQADSVPMAQLDAAFKLTAVGNNEILAAWLELSIRQGYEPSNERLRRFLMDVGRRKFLSPLYRALMETPAGAERARSIYADARPRYHAVSAQTLDGIVTKG